MPRTTNHHRSSPIDIWDCIRTSPHISLPPPLSLSISSLANICPRTQRLGFCIYEQIRIYRYINVSSMFAFLYLPVSLTLAAPKSYRRTPPEIRSVTPSANFNFDESAVRHLTAAVTTSYCWSKYFHSFDSSLENKCWTYKKWKKISFLFHPYRISINTY